MEAGLDPYALAVIFCGIAAGAFVKGLTGVGLPLVAIPFIAGFLGAEHSVAVMQIPGLVSNAWLLWSTRQAASGMTLRYEMLVPAFVMLFFGVWFLDSSDNRTIILLLAGVVAAFLFLLVFNPSFRLVGVRGRLLTAGASLCGGFVQGATGVSGPLFSTLILSFRLSKDAFVFYNALLFGVFNLLQLGILTAFGLMSWLRVTESLIVLIPMLIFQYLGMRVRGAVSLKFFNGVVIGMIALMEVKLLWEGFGG